MQILTIDMSGDRTFQNQMIAAASQLRKRLVARGYNTVYRTQGASVVLRTSAPAEILHAEKLQVAALATM